MTDAAKGLAGASAWEQDLYAHLTNHVWNERALLEEYVAAADATGSKAFAYLVKLLIADERRHHVLFEELAASLKSEAELRREDPVVPFMDFDRVDPANVRALTKQLMEREQQDLQELKKLQKDLRDVKDTTLWSLLVDLMQRDTDKHIAILRFARDHI
jgi:rubrerythrin